MNRMERRAIRIVELEEDLADVKKALTDFIWPPDETPEQRNQKILKAAALAGCERPCFTESSGGQEDGGASDKIVIARKVLDELKERFARGVEDIQKRREIPIMPSHQFDSLIESLFPEFYNGDFPEDGDNTQFGP